VNPIPLFQTRQTMTLPPPSHLADHRPLPSLNQPLPVPTFPPVMSTAAKSGLKANKPTEFMGSYTKSEEFFARMRDLHRPHGTLHLRQSKKSLSSSLISKALLLPPGRGSISARHTIDRTLSTNSRRIFNAAYGDPNKKSNTLTKLERLIKANVPLNSTLPTSSSSRPKQAYRMKVTSSAD